MRRFPRSSAHSGASRGRATSATRSGLWILEEVDIEVAVAPVPSAAEIESIVATRLDRTQLRCRPLTSAFPRDRRSKRRRSDPFIARPRARDRRRRRTGPRSCSNRTSRRDTTPDRIRARSDALVLVAHRRESTARAKSASATICSSSEVTVKPRTPTGDDTAGSPAARYSITLRLVPAPDDIGLRPTFAVEPADRATRHPKSAREDDVRRAAATLERQTMRSGENEHDSGAAGAANRRETNLAASMIRWVVAAHEQRNPLRRTGPRPDAAANVASHRARWPFSLHQRYKPRASNVSSVRHETELGHRGCQPLEEVSVVSSSRR